MKYELALKLKEAGFNQLKAFEAYYINAGLVKGVVDNQMYDKDSGFREYKVVAIPTLSELIEACLDFDHDNTFHLECIKDQVKWFAEVFNFGIRVAQENGSTPEEAVGNLFLSLKEKYATNSK